MDQNNQQREIVLDDLRGLVSGEVYCNDIFVQLYASDASIYEIRPLAVVRPRSIADVVECVRYAAEKHIPIHARGAGTDLSGGSLGPGLVIDFSRYLHRVLRIGAETVRVQAGVVHERLNTQLRRTGRIFGPDPATSAVTTIGGMIAVDAAGSRWLRYGSTRRHVRRLQVVTADGELIEVGREPIAGGADVQTNQRKRELVGRLAVLLDEHAELIRRHRPKCPTGRCGYDLSDVLEVRQTQTDKLGATGVSPVLRRKHGQDARATNFDNVLGDGYLDLARLLVGSEGTLALITEAELDTDAPARHRGVAMLLFDGIEKAARAALRILEHHPTACDLIDRRYISLARETEVRFDLLIPPETESVLLVELDGDEPLEVRRRLEELIEEVWHRERLAFGARSAFDRNEMELFWRLSNKVPKMSYPVMGPSRPIPVIEDVAVPPEILPDFLVRVQNVLKRLEVTAALFSHVGQGQLHIRPLLNLSDPGDVQRMRRLADELYQEVFDAGGTITSEHACGLSRTAFISRQVGPLYEVFRQVKEIFDPENIFNPGKIVGDDPELLTRNLHLTIPALQQHGQDARATAVSAATRQINHTADEEESSVLRDLVELQLDWDPTRPSDAVAQCSRCGECRTQAADVRMCPILRISPSEESSPRAKANLIGGVLTGRIGLETLTGDEFKAIADLCVHCHMCRLECPAGVDIPGIMRDGKAAYVSSNGLRPTDWVITHIDTLSALGSLFSPVTNWAVGNRQMRWIMEKTLGIAQGRKLPRVTSRSFIRRATRRRLTRHTRHGGQKVVYFIDMYANRHDPQLASALVAVLEHNGVAIYVPPRQKPSGMISIACGALDQARRLAAWNIELLAESVRQGYHVVTTEPSATLCLIHEYPQLIDDDDARLVAENTSQACSYLWKMHTSGKLQLDLKPINAALGYHQPCHLKALEVGSPGENLLGLIPGLRVEHLEEGCSGMAGAFGLKRANYRSSLRAGRALISRLRDPKIQAGVTECSACKIQMEQGTTKPTVHPIKLLALSYGLMPEIDRLLKTPGEDLIVT